VGTASGDCLTMPELGIWKVIGSQPVNPIQELTVVSNPDLNGEYRYAIISVTYSSGVNSFILINNNEMVQCTRNAEGIFVNDPIPEGGEEIVKWFLQRFDIYVL